MANLTNLNYVKARTDSKHIVLTLADYWPLWSDPIFAFLRKWMRKVQTDSRGKVQIAYLDISGPMNPKNGAAGGFESWEVEGQHVDIVEGATSPYFELLHNVFRINYLYRWFLYGTDIRGATRAYLQCMKEIPEVNDEFTKVNLKWLWGFGALPLCIQTKNVHVRSLADLNGLKLAGEGPRLYPGLFEKIGVKMVYMDHADTTADDLTSPEYMHTRRGLADGNISLAEFLSDKTMNGASIIKYVSFLDFPPEPKDFYLMNLNVWNNLPSDVQQVFENSSEWAQEEIIKVMEHTTQEAINYARSKGVRFSYLPKEDQKHFNEYMEIIAVQKAAELDNAGIPGTKIFRRTREIIDEYEANKKPLATWQGLSY